MRNIDEFKSFYNNKKIFIISNKETLEKTKNKVLTI
jgi:hypothetical protein